MERICDFDFLEGKWKVLNRRLNERLAGCTEWSEFTLDYEFHSQMLGRMNMDRIYGDRDGQYFEGASVRTYDDKTGMWVIYWSDLDHPGLTENVRGCFNGEIGTFYGMDTVGSARYMLRFIWNLESKEHPVWEQAYFDPETGEWETNWIMKFRRV